MCRQSVQELGVFLCQTFKQVTMKNLLKVTTVAILLFFTSCSDDSTSIDSPTAKMTDRLKNKSFYSNEFESLIVIDGSKFLEGTIKQNDCYKMVEYKMTIAKNTNDELTGSMTLNDVTMAFEISLNSQNNKLIMYFYDDTDLLMRVDAILNDACYES